MKTLCKVVNILCLILSILGAAVATVFIIKDKTGDVGFLNDITKLDLWIIVSCLLVTTALYISLLFNDNRSICIVGIIVCLLGSFQSYGAALVIGSGFMFKIIYNAYLDGQKRKEANAIPVVIHDNISNNNPYLEESTNYNNTNNDIRTTNDNVIINYREYMKPYYIFYILSIILSIAYIFLLVYGFIAAVDYFRGLDLSVSKVIFGIFVLPIFGILALALAIDIIYGLIASILAIIVPSKVTLSLNVVLGFLSFTFLNAAASLSILRNAENENKNIENY